MAERADLWEAGVTYVVGHQRPDTDAIAAALGYAWYLAAVGHERIVAARAGQPNVQTQFALERFRQEPPRLLAEVAPTFGHAARREAPVAPEAPLSEALACLAGSGRPVAVVGANGEPLGAITAVALARALSEGPAGADRLAQPCRPLVADLPAFTARERISDHRAALLRSETDDFLVLDEEGRYLGVATRAGILDPPRARLILVDHNELSQAVAGAEEAEIAAVLDHHRLGNPPTAMPIPFVVEPVGSTSTLVAEQCRAGELDLPPELAGMLVSGILSDTLVLNSPTATGRDRIAVEWLAGRAGVDPQEYGAELLHVSAGLGTRDAGEIVDGDRKTYPMGGRTISIGQVEVTSLQELPRRREDLLAALEAQRGREGLALACLMVTDVVAGRSQLLCRGDARVLGALPFARAGADEFDLGGMVSRKKQLVPALHAVLEVA